MRCASVKFLWLHILVCFSSSQFQNFWLAYFHSFCLQSVFLPPNKTIPSHYKSCYCRFKFVMLAMLSHPYNMIKTLPSTSRSQRNSLVCFISLLLMKFFLYILETLNNNFLSSWYAFCPFFVACLEELRFIVLGSLPAHARHLFHATSTLHCINFIWNIRLF